MVIFSHRYLDSDRINFKTLLFLPVYWSIWTSSYNAYIKVQLFFFNGASTMSNNLLQRIYIKVQLFFLNGASTMSNNLFNELIDARMKKIITWDAHFALKRQFWNPLRKNKRKENETNQRKKNPTINQKSKSKTSKATSGFFPIRMGNSDWMKHDFRVIFWFAIDFLRFTQTSASETYLNTNNTNSFCLKKLLEVVKSQSSYTLLISGVTEKARLLLFRIVTSTNL